jgi:PTH1 family peptidyl-tRNA hydrolase
VSHLILGLGNPGEEYRATRHNAGFRVVDALARRWGVRVDRAECNALTARGVLGAAAAVAPGAVPGLGAVPGEALAAGGGAASALAAVDAAPEGAGEIAVLVAQPMTYMNRSGFAARCLMESHGFAAERILVVYDDVNLPLGRLRLRRAGSPAGHRGMESIVENLRTDQIARLRLGIARSDGPPAGGDELVDFVLAPFEAAEEEALGPLVERAADACEVWLRQGIEAAMNRFNAS